MSTPYTGKRNHYGLKEPMKKYYSIGEIAPVIGVNESAIRYWSEEFGLELARTVGGHNRRRFTKENIEQLKEIKRLLKEELYTIAGVKKKLNATI